jgi:hypothetical protein
MNIFKIFSSIKFIKSLFCVIFVALIMTLYEYSLFFFVLIPASKKSLNTNLDKLNKEQFNNTNDRGYLSGISNLFDNIKNIDLSNINREEIQELLKQEEDREGLIKDIQYTYYDREAELITSISSYSITVAIIMIVILISLLLLLRYIIIKNNSKIDLSMKGNIIITSTLVLLMQGFFYLYSSNYKFPGTGSVMYNTYGPKSKQPQVSGEIAILVYDKLLED